MPLIFATQVTPIATIFLAAGGIATAGLRHAFHYSVFGIPYSEGLPVILDPKIKCFRAIA